jgi:hypothetical protein
MNRQSLLLTAKADAAWEREIKAARLPSNDPHRLPYPEAVQRAMRAWAPLHAAAERARRTVAS